MENTEEVFIQTLDRLFPSQVATYIKNLYNDMVKFQDIGLISMSDLPNLDVTLNDLCLLNDYTDSELQFIIRDVMFKFIIKTLDENGLIIVSDEDAVNLKTLSDITAAINMYLNDESAKPIQLDNIEDDGLYESIASLISMYSTMNAIQAREILVDANNDFCSKLNLCLLNNQANNENDDEEYRFDLVHRVTRRDSNYIGTKIVNDLVTGDLNMLLLDIKEDQKVLLKYLNQAKTPTESVNELIAYLFILDIDNTNIMNFVNENLNFENINFIKNSNDKKFEYLRLLENRIKQ